MQSPIVLKRGDFNETVDRVQKRLVALNLLTPDQYATGHGRFGPATESAVRAWQQSVLVDGNLDQHELDLMFPPVPPVATPALPGPFNGMAALIDRYGKPWDDVDAWGRANLAPCKLPGLLVSLTRRGEIWCNRDIVPILSDTLQDVCDSGLAGLVKTFDGCWNVRKQRFTTDAWSTHTWAVAVDFNAAQNQLGKQPTPEQMKLVPIFERHGWISGARFRGARVDAMHWQYVSGM